MWTVSYHKLFSLFDCFVGFDWDGFRFFIVFTPRAIRILAFWWRIDITTKSIPKIIFAIDNTIPLIYANDSKIARISPFRIVEG
jgi:hypothetical protein